jgi:hypothetical protein
MKLRPFASFSEESAILPKQSKYSVYLQASRREMEKFVCVKMAVHFAGA